MIKFLFDAEETCNGLKGLYLPQCYMIYEHFGKKNETIKAEFKETRSDGRNIHRPTDINCAIKVKPEPSLKSRPLPHLAVTLELHDWITSDESETTDRRILSEL